MSLYPEFARLLNFYLKERDRPTRWLARRLNVHPTTVMRWQNGETRPRKPEIIGKIADVFGVEDKSTRRALFTAAGYSEISTTETKAVDTDVTSPAQHKSEIVAYDDQFWAGREELVQEISQQIRWGRRLILLTGMAGIGKTALAERVVYGLLRTELQMVQRVNFEHQEPSRDFATIATEWLEEWGEIISPLERLSDHQLQRRLIAQLKAQPRLILIDAFEKLPAASNAMRMDEWIQSDWGQFLQSVLSVESFQSTLIITSQTLPSGLVGTANRYPNFWMHKSLGGLTDKEQAVLFQKAGFDMEYNNQATSYLLQIGRVYGGHPLALRAIIGEIKESFAGNVLVYWQEFGHEIERVEHDLATAAGVTTTQAAMDDWQLDRYSTALKQQVHDRVNDAFVRLQQYAPIAYRLLCEGTAHREPVPRHWWLQYLAFDDYAQEQIKEALQTLCDRYLVEESYDVQGNRQIGLHNLVRSTALKHRERLYPVTPEDFV